jgi:hypothetical protein
MKHIAYSFLLFLALSPASGFAQGNFMVSSITEFLPESVTNMTMEALIIFCKSDMPLV